MKPTQGAFERLALRPKECARALGIDTRTLRRWQQNEGLPLVRVGGAVLFPVAELRAWLAGRVESERRVDRVADEILRGL